MLVAFHRQEYKKNYMKINFCEFAKKPRTMKLLNTKLNFCVTSKVLAVYLTVLFFKCINEAY